jgi:hypothetical protein
MPRFRVEMPSPKAKRMLATGAIVVAFTDGFTGHTIRHILAASPAPWSSTSPRATCGAEI